MTRFFRQSYGLSTVLATMFYVGLVAYIAWEVIVAPLAIWAVEGPALWVASHTDYGLVNRAVLNVAYPLDRPMYLPEVRTQFLLEMRTMLAHMVLVLAAFNLWMFALVGGVWPNMKKAVLVLTDPGGWGLPRTEYRKIVWIRPGGTLANWLEGPREWLASEDHQMQLFGAVLAVVGLIGALLTGQRVWILALMVGSFLFAGGISLEDEHKERPYRAWAQIPAAVSLVLAIYWLVQLFQWLGAVLR